METIQDESVVLFAKAAALLTSSLFSILFGLMPLKILWSLRNAYYSAGNVAQPEQHRKRWSLALCALTCFSGGVFIGTSMMSMIPELQIHFSCVKRIVAHDQSYNSLMAYPWPEFTISMGFFAIFLLEELVLLVLKQRETKKSSHECVLSQGEGNPMLRSRLDVSYKRRMNEQIRCCDLVESPIHPHRHSHLARSIVILTTLSFHTLVESMRYALHDTTKAIWTLFWTSNIHQAVLSFALGTQLARTHRRNVGLVIMAVCLFSVCIPLGFLSGLALDMSRQKLLTEETIVMVLEGVSIGAFLYVTFYEVLSHELNNEHPSFMKLFCISTGCAAIGALSFFDRRNVRFGEEVH